MDSDEEAEWLQLEEEDAAAALAQARQEKEASINLKRARHEQETQPRNVAEIFDLANVVADPGVRRPILWCRTWMITFWQGVIQGAHARWLLATIITRLRFLIAELCLLAGSVRNAYHTKYSSYFVDGPPHCNILRKGVFAAGAAFAFLTALFVELHYIFYAKSRSAAAASPPIIHGGGIGMTRI